ncbi:MAG: hypothetical protein Q4B45_10410 [Coriobacteriia bacterium]|nr:hypothetical protein [Coriobacteriia bacterium]
MADTQDKRQGRRQGSARAALVVGCGLCAAGIAAAAAQPEALLSGALCAGGAAVLAASVHELRAARRLGTGDAQAGEAETAARVEQETPGEPEAAASPEACAEPGAEALPGAAADAPPHGPEAADAPEPSVPEPRRPAPSPDPDQQRWLEIESLLLRSNDVAASLADLLRSGESPAELRVVLERLGPEQLDGAPKFEATRNEHNSRWAMWCAAEPADDDYDRMEAVELALNAVDHLRFHPSCNSELPMDRRVAAALELAGAPLVPSPADDAARAYLSGAEKDGEWRARLCIADFAKRIRSDVHMDIMFQVNIGDGIAVIDLEVPRPGAFALFSHDTAERAAVARTFALRSCLLMGEGAFRASARMARVVVNGHEHGTHTPVISLDLTPSGLGRLWEEAAALAAGELPRGLGIRWFTSADGRLAPVEPFMERWDDAIAPLSRWGDVEENRLPAPGAVAATCKATSISDLGINEKTVRISAWNEASGWIGYSTRRAVAAFEARRKKAADATVAEACARVSRALVEGELDVVDRKAMALLFVDGGELTDVVRSTARRLNRQPVHTAEELETAVARLEAALEPAAQTARYEDDTENVFRYFNSTAERVRYNHLVRDDGRELRLVPDEYYAAHTQAASILVALGRAEEALPHADELVRVAPVTPGAALTRVRVLEELSRIYEARDLLVDAIGYASCLSDMAVCLYRLAFMEWKLGRAKTSIACYQRAADLNTEVSERALREMNDVIETSRGISALSAEEVRDELAAARIPYGDVEGLRTMAREAAIACTDAGLLSAARTLTGVLLEVEGDDVLQDVYGSLLPTRP